MLSHVEQKQLPYTAQQMFELVADVGKYKEFAPWCMGSRVTKRESEDVFLADLIVGYKIFREKFSSRVILSRHNKITIEYLKGPLKNLKNTWVFTDAENGSCVIDFSVEFEFKNQALQGLANMFFNEVVKRMVGAFEARAKKIYGNKS